MSGFDTSKNVTAEHLLEFILGTALDPNQKLRALRKWAEEHCKGAVAPEPVKPKKSKRSSYKAA